MKDRADRQLAVFEKKPKPQLNVVDFYFGRRDGAGDLN